MVLVSAIHQYGSCLFVFLIEIGCQLFKTCFFFFSLKYDFWVLLWKRGSMEAPWEPYEQLIALALGRREPRFSLSPAPLAAKWHRPHRLHEGEMRCDRYNLSSG